MELVKIDLAKPCRAAMIAVPNYISPADYLELEQASPHRHEYRQGLAYAMAGGTDNHDRMALNLLTLINLHLGNSDCRFHSGNVKVAYQDQFYYYPDIFVTCDPRDRLDRQVKRYPKLIGEVLSPSTQLFDRTQKFEDYQKLDSLMEYLLIAQDQPLVSCYRRQVDGSWALAVYQTGDQVMLTSLNLEFPISALYQGLD